MLYLILRFMKVSGNIARRIRSTSFPVQPAVARLGATMAELCIDDFFHFGDGDLQVRFNAPKRQITR